MAFRFQEIVLKATLFNVQGRTCEWHQESTFDLKNDLLKTRDAVIMEYNFNPGN